VWENLAFGVCISENLSALRDKEFANLNPQVRICKLKRIILLCREGISFILTKLHNFYRVRIDTDMYPFPSTHNSTLLFGICSYELNFNSAEQNQF
jgi:hypothetical protein